MPNNARLRTLGNSLFGMWIAAALLSSPAWAQPAALEQPRLIQSLTFGPDGVECVGDEKLCDAVSETLLRASDPNQARSSALSGQSTSGIPAISFALPGVRAGAVQPIEPALSPVSVSAHPSRPWPGPSAEISDTRSQPSMETTKIGSRKILTRCVRGSGQPTALGEGSYTLSCIDIILGDDDVVYLSGPSGAPSLLFGKGA